MLEYRGLTYTYPGGDQPALQAIGLDVRPGDLLAVVGQSGSGKSSLLWAANGLVPHFYGGRFAGDVVVCGLSTRSSTPQDLADHVGTVFQEPALRFVSRSVLDEIAFGLEIAGVPQREMQRQVVDVVERLGLGGLVDRRLDQVSGGEQQRVALAAALARGPEILLLDEPTSQLDRGGASALFAWLEERGKEEGVATLVAEHRLEDLDKVATGAAYLNPQGRLVATGGLADVWAAMPYAPPSVMARRRLGIDDADPHGQQRLLSVLRELAQSQEPPEAAVFGDVLLSGRGIGAAYGDIPALHDVDIDLTEGTVTAILGENGSGKTTLLRALMGLMPIDRGEVHLRGRRIDDRPVSELAGSIGYVPQWPSALLFADSVRDELRFTLDQQDGAAPKSSWVEQLLDRLDLTDVADRYPRDLSSGQRQRAALAAVLVAEPKVLLLDEPTLGMDPMAKRQLATLLRGLASDGAAIAVATHDVEFAASVSDQAAILDSGRLTAKGPTAVTLYQRTDYRTALQALAGAPWPATPEEAEAASERFHKSSA
jgi:energy-coupling factor transporter ATP-binding protein EcfA2